MLTSACWVLGFSLLGSLGAGLGVLGFQVLGFRILGLYYRGLWFENILNLHGRRSTAQDILPQTLNPKPPKPYYKTYTLKRFWTRSKDKPRSHKSEARETGSASRVSGSLCESSCWRSVLQKVPFSFSAICAAATCIPEPGTGIAPGGLIAQHISSSRLTLFS